jgi:hypothetical protein
MTSSKIWAGPWQAEITGQLPTSGFILWQMTAAISSSLREMAYCEGAGSVDTAADEGDNHGAFLEEWRVKPVGTS